MTEYQEPTQADYLYAHIEVLEEENKRLQTENAKLRSLVEALKEAVAYASLYHSFPDMPHKQLRILGKKMMQNVDAEKYIAELWEGLEKRNATASKQTEQSEKEFAKLNNMFNMLHYLHGKVNK